MTQGEALKILKTGANVFLTGEPGAGKTHTINKYIAYLKMQKVGVAVTASTGIAATHIGGVTIHSWSGIGIKKILSAYELDRLATNERLARRILKASVLIIDEISMLDGATLSLVDTVLRVVRVKDSPFGGVQIILVGDFFQLPPVARAGEPAPRFAFESDAWGNANPVVCYISEQYRQSDDTLLEILGALRRGSVEVAHLAQLDKRRVNPHDNNEYSENITTLFPHNANVDQLNLEALSKLEGKTRAFEMETKGAVPLVEQLKRGCLSPEKLELKIGAMVMFTKNSFDQGFVNGTVGMITSFDKDDGFPTVETKKGETICAYPMEWTIMDGDKTLAKITQIPLRLAWSITVHKSQGMSLDRAMMDLSGAFAYGQGYVALSRVRTLSGLFLAGYNARTFEVHPQIIKQDKVFRTLSESTRNTFGKIEPDILLEMHKNFVVANGGSWNTKKVSTDKNNNSLKSEGSTLDETFKLIREAGSVAEIAKNRGFRESTILKHIEDLISQGRLSVDDLKHLLPKDKKLVNDFENIYKAFNEHGSQYLKPIFKALGGMQSYETIRFARLFVEK